MKKKSKEVQCVLNPTSNGKNPSTLNTKKQPDHYIMWIYYITLFYFFFKFFFKSLSMTCEFMNIYLQRVETTAVQIWPLLSSKWLSGNVAGDWFRDWTVLCWGKELARKGKVPICGTVLTEAPVTLKLVAQIQSCVVCKIKKKKKLIKTEVVTKDLNQKMIKIEQLNIYWLWIFSMAGCRQVH